MVERKVYTLKASIWDCILHNHCKDLRVLHTEGVGGFVGQSGSWLVA